MLQTGNWVVPTLYGEPLFTKPPGMYAAIALCSWPFGEVSEWTARLPSASAASITVLLMYWFFARQLAVRGAVGRRDHADVGVLAGALDLRGNRYVAGGLGDGLHSFFLEGHFPESDDDDLQSR